VILLGLGLRGFTFQRVFLGDASVFPIGDAYYRLRRAEFSLLRLPDACHPNAFGQRLVGDALADVLAGVLPPSPR